MRKIEQNIVGAFVHCQPAVQSNTMTDGLELKLHGNTIAQWRGRELWVTLAGWPSPTTKSRLNALARLMGDLTGALPFTVWQSKGRQFIATTFNSVERELDSDEWVRVM